MQWWLVLVFGVVAFVASTECSFNKYKVTTYKKHTTTNGDVNVSKVGHKDWSNADFLNGKVHDVGSWSSKHEPYFQQQQLRRQQQQNQPSLQLNKPSKFKSKQLKLKQQTNEIDLEPIPNIDQPPQPTNPLKNFNQIAVKNPNLSTVFKQQQNIQENKTFKESGCRGAKLCCQGKDNTCVTLGKRMNGKNTVTCFCDSVCLPLGDCCTDYQEQCPIIDCVLGQWTEWSECNVKCGYGAKQRTRKVEVENKNGGKKCEPTVQKQACENKICKQVRSAALTTGGGGGGAGGAEEMTEIGRIVLSSFSQWRTSKEYDPYKDIRRFIYERNGNVALEKQQPTYCAVYKLNQVHPRCRTNPLLDRNILLKPGSRICVECQYTASQAVLGNRCYGHGVYERETRWLSLNNMGCYGTWMKETKKENCLCGTSHPELPSYIFV